MAPWVVSHFPPHKIYTEAFSGAASVLLHKPKSNVEVLNDLDGEIVNLFRVLREPASVRALSYLLHLTPFAREEFNAAYEPSSDAIEQARRTVTRCFMGYGSSASCGNKTGFCVSNSNGEPHQAPRAWGNYPDELPNFLKRLRRAIVESRPSTDVLQRFDSADTLHYVDPPYVHSTRSASNTRNYRHEMNDEQHRELARVLDSLQGMVVLSGYSGALYDELFANWQRIERTAYTLGAGKRTEVLWLNAATQRALQS